MTASYEQIIGGRYALYGPIASGGMAAVHFGRLLGTGGFARTVAIKRLRGEFLDKPEVITTLLDEARLASRIRHPNVVPTLDNFDRPISYYDRALECFTYTQHRKRMQDCNYYLALIYHQLEADPAMMAKRDHHAAECLKLQGHMNKAVMDKDDFPELWITEKHLPQ